MIIPTIRCLKCSNNNVWWLFCQIYYIPTFNQIYQNVSFATFKKYNKTTKSPIWKYNYTRHSLLLWHIQLKPSTVDLLFYWKKILTICTYPSSLTPCPNKFHDIEKDLNWDKFTNREKITLSEARRAQAIGFLAQYYFFVSCVP